MLRRLILLATLSFATTSLACEQGPHPEPAEMAAKMAEHLDLDEAMQATIEAVLTEARVEAEPLVAGVKDKHEALLEERAKEEPGVRAVRRLVHHIADLKADLFLLKLETGDEIEALLPEEARARFHLFRERRAMHGGRERRAEAAPDAFFDL